MPSLVELQRRIRNAIVDGDVEPVVPLLHGGLLPARRLAIHRRHFRASLTAALMGRFPATLWLVGGSRLGAAAEQFVRKRPPTAPCIAEYGQDFPAFLATCDETSRLTYVPEFAALDWHLGRLAISADATPMALEPFLAAAPDDLGGVVISLQSGTHYLSTSWPIDVLMSAYLNDAAPETWTLVDEPVWLEARGSRGTLGFRRLDAASHAFRRALASGARLGDAASAALELDPAFDTGAALVTMIEQGLITAIFLARTGAV